MLNKKLLSERDICTKFITPAIVQAGWDRHTQFLEEVSFTAGKIYVRGKLAARGKGKRADYILYYKPNIPVAIIEAKDNKHSVRAGIQQALDYAHILDIPCVFSSNGDGFLFHDRTAAQDLLGFENLTGLNPAIEQELPLEQFPSPAELWQRYKRYKGITTEEAERIVAQDYYADGSGRSPRYYQQIAINRTVEAIAKGQNRIMLVMATGTGKTYTAFQIVWRLWKARVKKRILFLADRNALISQTKRGDFKHFGDQMTVVKHGKIDKAYEIYLALYQGLSVEAPFDPNFPISQFPNFLFQAFSPDFFDLIVIDECHRGSASADSTWRQILDYFSGAKTTTGYANKVYVNSVDVTVLVSRDLHFDHEGKPITTSLKDHTSKLIKGQYASLDAFLNRWKSTERKEALIQELQEQGVPVDALRDAVNREVDLFDLICHVAYDQPPLTRRERALNVKKRNYFTQYGEQARLVLEALLDKYADEGIENLESLEVLKVRPLTQFGSALEIVRMFGGKDGFLRAVRELEGEIYRVA